jgi:hypothetical protein
MTELELLEMLSGVQSSYIQQADAFREGRLRIVRKKRPVVTALKILSVAAMFVLILGAGYFGLQNLAAKQASEKASETMAAQSGAMADAEDWQRMVLRDGIRFYNGDFADSYNSYTVSEFCGVLAKWMGTEEAPKPARYAKLDMDGDGLEELVVELEGTGDLPRLVLGSFDGQIMGEIYYERQMSQLKADGVFYASGGIGNRSWARLQRSADGWTVEDLEGDYTDEPDAVWTQWVSLGSAEVTNGNSDTTEVTPELLGRDASCNLTVWQGSDEYPVAADLFIGDGYSLYIPREGWVHEVIDYHGTTADRWVCADQTLEEFGLNSMLDTTNREALRKFYDQQYPTRLTVLFRPGMDDQAIRDWVIEANPDWDVTQNARGELFADGATVEFFRTETGVFICIMETPAFGTGGLGVLGTMCGSFGGWPSGISGYLTGVSGRDAETTFMMNRYIEAEQRWEEYPVDCRLYRTYGYSTYIPKEGVAFRNADGEVRYGGYAASIWTCEKNVNVWFAVVKLDTTNFSEAIQWGLSTAGSDYNLYEDKSGGVSGDSADGTEFLSISFQEKDFNGIYAVIQNYPIAETDNLSAYVKIMADEFRTE